jgi:(S)-mandelate dehydrogenase
MSGRKPASVADYGRLAQQRLPRWVFDYLDGGAEDEIVLRRNRSALETVRLQPSVLCDTSQPSLALELLGRRASAPYLIAPTGLNGLLWPAGGDIALARAAARHGVPFVLSTASTTPLEAVAAAAPEGDNWLQLYVLEHRSIAENLMRRARAAGYRVLVLTVDVAMSGKRERDLRNGFRLPFRLTPALLWDMARHPSWTLQVLRHGAPEMPNLQLPGQGDSRQAQAALLSRRMDLTLCWDDLAWLRDHWPGPIVLKGLLSVADAERAAQLGVEGIVLSNHGGRQLDAVAAPIEVLPQVAAAVGGRLSVMIDSGFRRGSDIAKARALGADAVLLGRPALYGLAVAGEAGVEAVLELLREELLRVMTLCGCVEITRFGSGQLEQLSVDRISAA